MSFSLFYFLKACILWKLHLLYFDRIIPPQLLPNPPNSQFIQSHVPSLLKKKTQTKTPQVHYSWLWSLPWNGVGIPDGTLLKKTDFPSHQQMNVNSSELEAGLCSDLPLYAGVSSGLCMSYACILLQPCVHMCIWVLCREAVFLKSSTSSSFKSLGVILLQCPKASSFEKLRSHDFS